jgi:hypothetical protein
MCAHRQLDTTNTRSKVDFNSDLKSLCLTSKYMSSLALPRLYSTVCVRLWDKRPLEAFFRSVGHGAGLHFGKTKTLIQENDEPPCERDTIILEFLGLPGEKYQSHGLSSGAQELTVQHVTQMFPKSEILRSFL